MSNKAKKFASQRAASKGATESAVELSQAGDLVEAQVNAGVAKEEVMAALMAAWRAKLGMHAKCSSKEKMH